MSAYESVRKGIYSDPTFEALTIEAAALYMWSFINPLCNWSGLYVVSKKRLEECKVPARLIDRTLGELHEANLLHRHEDMLWVRSRIKYLYTRGHKIAQAILRELVLVDPKNPLRASLIYHYTEERGNEYQWLSPVLRTLEVVPHTADHKVPQTRVFRESSESALLLVGSVEEERETLKEKNDLLAEFDLWLADHQAVTAMPPPKKGTVARADLQTAFLARRKEEYSLDDLKLATRGAFNDEHRRLHGYFGGVSVLRPTKVYDLIEKGRRVGAESTTGQNVVQMNRKCARCKLREVQPGYGAFCDECAERISDGDEAA